VKAKRKKCFWGGIISTADGVKVSSKKLKKGFLKRTPPKTRKSHLRAKRKKKKPTIARRHSRRKDSRDPSKERKVFHKPKNSE